uniref:Complex 1 LYR protein domain-containing protein n=1 Tax=Lotharella globosa TaxID=91324 RepID=A0A7S3Z897_9EUKA
MASARSTVLRLYRDILRRGRHWKDGTEPAEARYIVEEARKLFRRNKDLDDQKAIHDKIKECESRVELAEHYGNPYPRMYYAQPGVIYKSGNRARKKINPDYMHSYYDEDEFGLNDAKDTK